MFWGKRCPMKEFLENYHPATTTFTARCGSFHASRSNTEVQNSVPINFLTFIKEAQLEGKICDTGIYCFCCKKLCFSFSRSVLHNLKHVLATVKGISLIITSIFFVEFHCTSCQFAYLNNGNCQAEKMIFVASVKMVETYCVVICPRTFHNFYPRCFFIINEILDSCYWREGVELASVVCSSHSKGRLGGEGDFGEEVEGSDCDGQFSTHINKCFVCVEKVLPPSLLLHYEQDYFFRKGGPLAAPSD